MFDFNKYDDASLIHNYDGFIDQNGNYYKVSHRRQSKNIDSHNEWAKAFLKQKLNIDDYNFNKFYSSIFSSVLLNGPAEILINCFGYVYYSHDAIIYKPIIKLPNPKILNYRVTQEQLDMLYSVMLYNNEDTNISIFYDDNDEYTYCGIEDGGYQRKFKY